MVDRLEQFKAELETKGSAPRPGVKDQLWSRVGLAVTVAGVVLALVAFALSDNTNNALDQSTDTSLGIAGVAITLLGVAIYIRYSLSSFLRFWMARLLYEQRLQNDRENPAGQVTSPASSAEDTVRVTSR